MAFYLFFDSLQHRNKNFEIRNMRGRFAFLAPYVYKKEKEIRPRMSQDISKIFF
jgi:hypothetical protein